MSPKVKEDLLLLQTYLSVDVFPNDKNTDQMFEQRVLLTLRW